MAVSRVNGGSGGRSDILNLLLFGTVRYKLYHSVYVKKCLLWSWVMDGFLIITQLQFNRFTCTIALADIGQYRERCVIMIYWANLVATMEQWI
jgi:hypothetical protein